MNSYKEEIVIYSLKSFLFSSNDLKIATFPFTLKNSADLSLNVCAKTTLSNYLEIY